MRSFDCHVARRVAVRALFPLAVSAWALLFSVHNLPLHAQSLYGSLVGNVTDASQAPIPGTQVTIRNQETGQARDTVTDEGGRYSFSDVGTGTYDVSFRKKGFATITETGLTVTITNVSRLDLSMRIGAVAESVQVSAQTAVLQTDSSEVARKSRARRCRMRTFHLAETTNSCFALYPECPRLPLRTRSRVTPPLIDGSGIPK